jgi:hypothetical protein
MRNLAKGCAMALFVSIIHETAFLWHLDSLFVQLFQELPSPFISIMKNGVNVLLHQEMAITSSKYAIKAI